MGFFKLLKTVAKYIQKLLNAVSVILLMAMVAIMFSQVFGRSVIGKSIIWSEEALRFLMIWLVFVGVATAIYYNDLSRFDMLQDMLPKFGRKAVLVAIDILIGVVLGLTTYGAFPLIARQMTQDAVSVPVKMGVVYSIIPICFIISLFYLVLHIVTVLTSDKLDLSEGEEEMV